MSTGSEQVVSPDLLNYGGDASGGNASSPISRAVKTYPVTGKVTYKGEPVADAVVTFRSTGMGETVAAAGRTDSSGHYALTTYKAEDGAVAGNNLVMISKTKTEGGDPSYSDVNSPTNYGKPMPKVTIKHLIPEKYSTVEKSGLTAQVKDSGTNDFPFELKD